MKRIRRRRDRTPRTGRRGSNGARARRCRRRGSARSPCPVHAHAEQQPAPSSEEHAADPVEDERVRYAAPRRPRRSRRARSGDRVAEPVDDLGDDVVDGAVRRVDPRARRRRPSSGETARLESSRSRRAMSVAHRVDVDRPRRGRLVALTTPGPLVLARGEEHLHGRVGEHDGADVAPLDDATAVLRRPRRAAARRGRRAPRDAPRRSTPRRSTSGPRIAVVTSRPSSRTRSPELDRRRPRGAAGDARHRRRGRRRARARRA